MDKIEILLIGCGKMGSSLLRGITNTNNFFSKIVVVDPFYEENIENSRNLQKVNFYKSTDEIDSLSSFDVIIIATKPNIYKDIFIDLKNRLDKGNDSLIISILAGITINKIEEIINPSPIIRSMPNIAASVGESMTALYGNRNVKKKHVNISDLIFESVGKKIWLDNELQLNSFTAISGSGPAYYFYLTECIQTIAIEEGFSKEASKIISRQLIVGAGKLSEFSDIDISQLRKNVTSKKGTTESALGVLNDNKSGLLIKLRQAIKKAKKRSEEISELS
tara:strand:- start:6955 stop:7788 length:834 start_codon:yes stop_codon:yes gene_type:complete